MRSLHGRLSVITLAALVFTAPAIGQQGNARPREPAPADELLLKDYRPHSIYKVPQTAISKARFPIIDVHTHPYARSDADVDRWVRIMDELGVEKSVIMTGATGSRFDEAIRRYARHTGRFSIWCGFDMRGYDRPDYGPAAVAELERCWRAGAEGVGELSDKGGGLRAPTNPSNLHIDDHRMDALLEKCAELGLTVNIHVGEPIWMYQPMDRANDGLMNALEWRLDNRRDILGHAEVVATLDRAAKRHPRTTFIACHFANCCYDLSILARMLDANANLYADIGARYAETATIPRFMAKFFDRYQDRLLYGTDMSFRREMYLTTFRILETEDEHFYDWTLFTYHWPLHGFGLPDGVLKKVYSDNARQILKRRRRPEDRRP
jgi:predicted TIM-barrel fold metal-dependent hydrolase